MTYKFSVGKVKLFQNGVLKKEIIPLTEISIRYSLTTHQERGPDGELIDEFKDTESLEVSFAYATDDYDLNLIKGEDYDITFEQTTEGRGISVTIASCKLTGYELTTTQNSFATTRVTFSKKGAIDSSPGEEPTKQKVKFGSVYLGDSAIVNTSYDGNVQTLIIPTALGVLIRSTQDMGGGALKITVRGYVKKDTRLELEQYLINLYSQLSTGKQDLTVEYGASSYTIPNCYWVSGRPEGDKTYSNFTLEFVKSAY